MHSLKIMVAALSAALMMTAGAVEKRAAGGRTFYHKVSKAPSVVYLKGFHSATQQGPTCNVYSAWMILRYYRVHITPAKIKKGAKNGEYKTSSFIAEKLDTVNFCFLCYYPKQGTDFGDVVKTCIDCGIPLQWGCNLKYAPKVRARRLSPTRDAGHARVIWGYECDKRTGVVTKIIFADSWGARKMRQKMEVDEACHMTMSMHPIFPKDTDPEVVAKLMAIPGMKRLQSAVASDGKKPDGAPDKKPDRKPRRKKKNDDR